MNSLLVRRQPSNNLLIFCQRYKKYIGNINQYIRCQVSTLIIKRKRNHKGAVERFLYIEKKTEQQGIIVCTWTHSIPFPSAFSMSHFSLFKIVIFFFTFPVVNHKFCSIFYQIKPSNHSTIASFNFKRYTFPV